MVPAALPSGLREPSGQRPPKKGLPSATPSRCPSRLQPSAAQTSATGLAGAWCLGRSPSASACGPPKQPDFLGKAGRGLARAPTLMARNESSAWQGSVPAGRSVPKPPAPSRACGISVELALPGQRGPYPSGALVPGQSFPNTALERYPEVLRETERFKQGC